MTLEDDPIETQVRRLKLFLNPKKSLLRPFLALFSLQNYLLLKTGWLVGNNPCIKWYTERMQSFGVSGNYWGVRRQLKKMAGIRLVREHTCARPCATSHGGRKAITKANFAEFYLNERVYAALVKVVREMFGFKFAIDVMNPEKLAKLISGFQASLKTEEVGYQASK